MKGKLALGALLLGLVAAAPAVGLIVEWPLENMVSDSQSIVRGHVIGQTSHWLDGPKSIIVTDVSFQVDESWKGAIAKQTVLTVRVNGGEVGDIGMKQEHQPGFAKDEDAVLFLWTMPDGDGRLSIYNDEQGRYTVAGNKVLSFKHQLTDLSTFKTTIERDVRSGR